MTGTDDPTTPARTWGPWTDMKGWLSGAAGLALGGDGRISAFINGANGNLWYSRINRDGTWPGFTNLQGGITDSPAPIQGRDGRIAVFVRGTNGSLWYRRQSALDGDYADWQNLGGGIHGSPAPVLTARGLIDVIVQGGNETLWHRRESDTGWADWKEISETAGLVPSPVDRANIAPVRDAEGLVHLFCRTAAGTLQHYVQTSPDSEYSGLDTLATNVKGMPLGLLDATGRLDVYYRGTDDALWHVFQDNAGKWQGQSRIGFYMLEDAAVVMGADGRLLSFQHGGDHAVWWSTENVVTDSTSWAWNSHPLGTPLDGRPTAILDHNGMVHVFVRHPDGSAYTISQTPA